MPMVCALLIVPRSGHCPGGVECGIRARNDGYGTARNRLYGVPDLMEGYNAEHEIQSGFGLIYAKKLRRWPLSLACLPPVFSLAISGNAVTSRYLSIMAKILGS
jgi:hypothetical protein